MAAAAAKFAGSVRDHWAIVLGFSSGEEKSDREQHREQPDHDDRDQQLFDEVVGVVAAAPGLGVVLGAQEAHGRTLAEPAVARSGPGRRFGERRFAPVELERRHDAVASHEQHVRGDSATTASGSSRTW